MNTRQIIDVKDLSVELGNRPILTDVTFKAYEGEVTVILGASGSGKTTVLKQLLALYPLQRGYVSLLGKDISTLQEDQQKELYLSLGVFYQNGGLLNSLTVAENVALPLQQHTELDPEIIDRMVRLKLSLVNMGHAYNLYPAELSGGMLKRAALARAIIMDPPLLCCDEPGAGLDPMSLEALDKLILDLKELLGMSIILVTHEVLSILRVADRIVFLDDGKVIFEGPLKEALESDNPTISDFFSKAKANSN